MVASCAWAETWTLDSCITYAIEHNINVRLNELSVEQAQQNVTRAKDGYLPQVQASAGQSWSLGRALTAENTYADRNTSSFNWGVSASLPIFNGLRTPRQIDYAKANLSQILEQYEAAKEDVSINVISAYLQVLYSAEMVDVSRRQVELSEYELQRRTALLEAGKIPEIDLLEAQSLLASDQMNLVQNRNNLSVSKIALVRLLDLDTDIDAFETALLSDAALPIMRPEEVYRASLSHNHTVMAQRKGITAAESNIRLAKTGYIPSLSFSTSIGSSYYRTSGFPNESFGSQMKHNYSTYFGLSLNIPIFDAFSTRNSIRQAKVEKLNAELRLEQSMDNLDHDIQEAYYQATGALKKYETSRIAEDYALKAFEAVQDKYNLGSATSAEYEQSKAKAYNATAERIQANYEHILRSRILNFYATGE